jgi:cobalt/nickel transport system permease protein
MTRARLVFVVAALVVTVALAMLVSPFASDSPDGLEKVAAEEGFESTATDHALADGPLADYGIEGIGDGPLSVALAGLVGVVLTMALAYAVSRGLRAVRGRGDGAQPLSAGAR